MPGTGFNSRRHADHGNNPKRIETPLTYQEANVKAKTMNHKGVAPHVTAGPCPQDPQSAGPAAAIIQSGSKMPGKRPKLLGNVYWVYFDPIAKEFACRRCPERRPLERGAMSGPIDADDFLGQMAAFERAHAKCATAQHAAPPLVSRRRAS